MIILSQIFGRIQDLNRHIVSKDQEEENVIEEDISTLAHELEWFERDLPDSIKNTPEDMAYSQYK